MSTVSPEPLVRIRDLRFRYPGADHDVLRIPSLDVRGLGLTALTGPSGAGKSTLVELLAGTLQESYDGTVEVLGQDWRSLVKDSERQRLLRRIGLIPQDYAFIAGKSVSQALAQDLADAQVPRQNQPGRIATALEEVGLAHFSDREVNRLSGGQRQRIAIARMLAREVDLVIADEPTANLDPELVVEVMALLRRLGERVPVIVVTHDSLVASLCDRTVLLQPSAPFEGPSPSSTLARNPRRSARLGVGAAISAALLAASAAIGFAMAHQDQHKTDSHKGRASATPTPSQPAAVAPATPFSQPTPWPFPVQPEDCGQLSFGADGNFGPATCLDGKPNLQAVLYVKDSKSELLHLGPYATPDQVQVAACHDLSSSAGGTRPITSTLFELADAENHWSFGGLTPTTITDGC